MICTDFLAIGVSGDQPDEAESGAKDYSPNYVVERGDGYEFVFQDEAEQIGHYRKRQIFFISNMEMLASVIGDQTIRTLELLAHGSVEPRKMEYPEYQNSGLLSVGKGGVLRFKVKKSDVKGTKYRRVELQQSGPTETWRPLLSPVEVEVSGEGYLVDLVQYSDRSHSHIPTLRKLKFHPNAEISVSGCSIGRDADFLRAFSLACGGVPVRAGISLQIVSGSRAPGAAVFDGFEGRTIVCEGEDCSWEDVWIGSKEYSAVVDFFHEKLPPPTGVASDRKESFRVPNGGDVKGLRRRR